MDIVIIGAQKAGTTWLHTMLKQQPRVGFSFMKEVHYFDMISNPDFCAKSRIEHLKRRKGQRWKFAGSAQKSYMDLVLNESEAFTDEWYVNSFRQKPENRAILAKHGSIVYFDATPAYSAMSEKGVAHMAELLPQIVPVLVLRDPMKRMVSGFSMSLSRRTDKKSWNLEQSIDHLRSAQVSRGDYARMIPLFRKYFSDLMIIPFGQIHSDPQSVMRQIEQKHGLDPIRYKGLKGKRNSHTGKVKLQPEVLSEIERLCAPQYEYLAREFGQDFLSTI